MVKKIDTQARRGIRGTNFWNIITTERKIRVRRGYPGGWAMPPFTARRANSPASKSGREVGSPAK
jgi:hypothetical protein